MKHFACVSKSPAKAHYNADDELYGWGIFSGVVAAISAVAAVVINGIRKG